MGRYYNTSTGREGKFMFATQESTDPDYMGMHENQNYLDYYADEDDVETIKAKLDEQYDLLGLPKEKRLYRLPKAELANEWKAQDKWEKENLHDLIFESFHKKDMEEAHKKYGDKAVHWASDKGDDYTDFERNPGLALALARVRLGLTILTDIEEDGCCELRAEL